jgi:hypothetical protein
MQLVKNNPYRILGLLAGTPTAKHVRHVNRLKESIEAEVDPDEDYSFPTFGSLDRSIDSINSASSKIHLENGKIAAALFWFYNGNEIEDDAAFDNIKDGSIKESVSIWAKLINDTNINQVNASAFFNISTLLLNSGIKDAKINETVLFKGLRLKLRFLESECYDDVLNVMNIENSKFSKKELQLVFLNQIFQEITKTQNYNSVTFISTINEIEFSAKDEFLNSFTEAPIKKIEEEISSSKSKRQLNKRDAEIFGKELFDKTEQSIQELQNILEKNDLRYQNIADKLANEILQCGIDFFQEFKDEDFDPSNDSLHLFNIASSIAVGNLVSQRCAEQTEELQEWIDEKPERERQKLIASDLEFITNKLQQLSHKDDSVINVQDLLDSCKPKLKNIKSHLGAQDEFYINVSTAIVRSAQNMLVQTVNDLIEKANEFYGIFTSESKKIIEKALDLTYKMGTFDMDKELKLNYSKNIDGIKKLARQLSISTLSPRENIQQQITRAERKLTDIQNTVYYRSELEAANNEMARIKEWQFLRSKSDRESQIKSQENKIRQLRVKSKQENANQVSTQQKTITDLKNKLKNAEY